MEENDSRTCEEERECEGTRQKESVRKTEGDTERKREREGGRGAGSRGGVSIIHPDRSGLSELEQWA